MDELWWDLTQWWDDSTFRQQIILAVIVGAVGLGFVLLEVAAKRNLGGDDDARRG